MTTNELLAIMDREAGLLTQDNWHAAAAVMAEAAEHLRARHEIDRLARVLVKLWDGTIPPTDWVNPSADLREAMDALATAIQRVKMNG